MNKIQKIFKYLIKIEDESELLLPAGAKILSVREQENNIVLYALVTSNIPSKRVLIRVVGTGHEIHFDTSTFSFLGTVSLYGGRLMFHVFYCDCLAEILRAGDN